MENLNVKGTVKWGYRTKAIFGKGVIIGLCIGSAISLILF